MEKTQSLVFLDREICEYHLKNNYSKKDNLFCYHPNRKQISDFYSSMADHFYQAKIKEPEDSDRRPRTLKIKSQIYQTIKDPLLACLPKSIPQNNIIDAESAQPTGMSTVPMFSEVEKTKKQKYFIAREVRDLLGHDIKQLLKEKEQVNFRRHYPLKEPRSHSEQQVKTQQLIKQFNRLLIKYKNNKLNIGTSLNLLEKQNAISFLACGENSADQKFKILNLFKKLYFETKSQEIDQNLIDYLVRFHINDKFTKKVNVKQPRKDKSTHQFSITTSQKQSLIKNSFARKSSQASLAAGHSLSKKNSKSHFFQQTQPVLKESLFKVNKFEKEKGIKLRSRVKTSHLNEKQKLNI